jgi:hypothetical protein
VVVHKTGDVVMPSGLRIDLNDGMEITAGMRCPSFCQQVSAAWDVNQYAIANYVAGSQMVLPRNTVFQCTGIQT